MIMKTSLYKNEIGKNEILELYNEKLDELEVDYESILLNTKFGKTHVIVCGDEGNPPLILIHGSRYSQGQWIFMNGTRLITWMGIMWKRILAVFTKCPQDGVCWLDLESGETPIS